MQARRRRRARLDDRGRVPQRRRLGQLTPGPVVQTVAVVGYAAAGLGGALLAAAIAFAPSFLVVVLGGRCFERLRSSAHARAFLDGAGPGGGRRDLRRARAARLGVDEAWQWVIAGVALVACSRGAAGVVATLLAAARPGGRRRPRRRRRCLADRRSLRSGARRRPPQARYCAEWTSSSTPAPRNSSAATRCRPTRRWPAGCGPQTLDEVVGQEHLLGAGDARCARRSSRAGRTRWCCYGPPGTGKTTLARIVAAQRERRLRGAERGRRPGAPRCAA